MQCVEPLLFERRLRRRLKNNRLDHDTSLQAAEVSVLPDQIAVHKHKESVNASVATAIYSTRQKLFIREIEMFQELFRHEQNEVFLWFQVCGAFFPLALQRFV